LREDENFVIFCYEFDDGIGGVVYLGAAGSSMLVRDQAGMYGGLPQTQQGFEHVNGGFLYTVLGYGGLNAVGALPAHRFV